MKTLNKLTYDKAELEIIDLTETDILTTSGDTWGGSLGGGALTDPDGWT